jgi:uncharacterized protein YpmB
VFSSILEIIRKSSQFSALGTKALGLTAIAAILFSATIVIIQSSYAQFEPSPSQQQEQQEGGQQVASDDGGLAATLNGSSSRTFESEEDGFRLQIPQG